MECELYSVALAAARRVAPRTDPSGVLQETKVQDADFPHEALGELGYRAECFGQKTYDQWPSLRASA